MPAQQHHTHCNMDLLHHLLHLLRLLIASYHLLRYCFTVNWLILVQDFLLEVMQQLWQRDQMILHHPKHFCHMTKEVQLINLLMEKFPSLQTMSLKKAY